MNSDDEITLKYLLDNHLVTSNIITKFFVGIEIINIFFVIKILRLTRKIYERAKLNLKNFNYIFF